MVPLYVYRYTCEIRWYLSVFQDPSVQNAVSASQNQQQNLDDYNPFANQQAQTGVAGNGPFPAGSQLGGPAPVLSTQSVDQSAPPPSYTATNQQQISSRDFEVSTWPMGPESWWSA